MTSAATPKGERRRHALVTAAADLLLEGGFDAVRHRAVAARAGLPLASTTYYFGSLDELVALAVEHNGNRELDAMRERIDEVTQRRRGVEATVDLIVDLLVGPEHGTGAIADADGGRERLIARYERFVASARHPELRDVQLRLRAQTDDLLAELLRRSGRIVREPQLRRLVAVVDGVVVGALSEVDPDPRGMARAMLLDLIDDLAPPTMR
ncbi:TetR/AcrR family transcriptional regulator [Rhodococcus sp. SGAir0479]|uniref:TetR/AcrR family transcriptional regulator n=1 Tax=Rhodococcus sp. SGAir0479 TaxID=2567884 RepID=UPI0010CCB7A8|nr:TetR family transcriptional regulator [Rhodococcus sp. SGAir0479]QCQ89755.1 TetR family transcriptional regulator [Rhodococcus sp. SGAir0479]